jgi:glyoxylase-like metal-dependent hydrolase (beta-lactamase superfamily II)
VTLTRVADGVSRVTGGVVNWYVVVDRGKATLVDAGVPGDWKLLLETVRSLELSLRDIDCVLLTHAHSDHTGFAERARVEAAATVRVHAADERAARTGKGGKSEGGASAYLKVLLRVEAYRTLFGLMRRSGLSIVPITELTVFADGEILERSGPAASPPRPRAHGGELRAPLRGPVGAVHRRLAGHARSVHGPRRSAGDAIPCQ